MDNWMAKTRHLHVTVKTVTRMPVGATSYFISLCPNERINTTPSEVFYDNDVIQFRKLEQGYTYSIMRGWDCVLGNQICQCDDVLTFEDADGTWKAVVGEGEWRRKSTRLGFKGYPLMAIEDLNQVEIEHGKGKRLRITAKSQFRR